MLLPVGVDARCVLGGRLAAGRDCLAFAALPVGLVSWWFCAS